MASIFRVSRGKANLVVLALVATQLFPNGAAAGAHDGLNVTTVSACRIGTIVVDTNLHIASTTCTWSVTNTSADRVTVNVDDLTWPTNEDVVRHADGAPTLSSPVLDGGETATLSQRFDYGPTLSTHFVDIVWHLRTTDVTTGAASASTFSFPRHLIHDAGCLTACVRGS